MTDKDKEELEKFKAFLLICACDWTKEERQKLLKEIKVILNGD